jgi:Flp pilus assembly protein TadB
VRVLWPLIADFIDPSKGPDQSGDFEVDPAFFFVLLGLGFLIGVVGHIARSRTVVAVGVILIFAATVFIPIALNVAH